MTRIEASTASATTPPSSSGRAHCVTSATARWVRCPLRPLSSRTSAPPSPAARELSGKKTIHNYVSVLRMALAAAVADELMPTNVAEAVAPRQASAPAHRSVLARGVGIDHHGSRLARSPDPRLHRTLVLVVNAPLRDQRTGMALRGFQGRHDRDRACAGGGVRKEPHQNGRSPPSAPSAPE